MKSRTSLRLASGVAPRLRPSSVSSLECAVEHPTRMRVLFTLSEAEGSGEPAVSARRRRISPLTFAQSTVARPSSVSPLESTLVRTHVCNSLRINTYKTPRNIHKTRSFKLCICNTYANERRNPFGMNRCTKHRGGGRGCGNLRDSPTSEPPDLSTEGAAAYALHPTPFTIQLGSGCSGPASKEVP